MVDGTVNKALRRRRAWSAAHGTTLSRSTSAQPAVQPALRVEQDDLDGVKDFEDVEQRPESAQEPDRITPRTSWSPVDYGESESAMEIARKVRTPSRVSLTRHP